MQRRAEAACLKAEATKFDSVPTHAMVSFELPLAVLDEELEVLAKHPKMPGEPVFGPHWHGSRFDKKWREWREQHGIEEMLEKWETPTHTATDDDHEQLARLLESWHEQTWQELHPKFGVNHQPGGAKQMIEEDRKSVDHLL